MGDFVKDFHASIIIKSKLVKQEEILSNLDYPKQVNYIHQILEHFQL
jgi:hypothetical protein